MKNSIPLHETMKLVPADPADTLIIFVHGFNVRDGGAQTVDRFAPFFKGLGYNVETDSADYGYFSLFMVRFNKHSAVVRIANAIRAAEATGKRVIIVSHSNGSNYTNKALRLLARSGHAMNNIIEVRLSPALNRTTATYASKCTVFYSRTDIWPWLSSLLFLHPWGGQGTFGYKGDCLLMKSWDYTDAVKRHSDWSNDDNLEFIGHEILKAAER